MASKTTDLLTRFEAHVREMDLFRKDDLLFLAVSGGLDSVVLTHLIYRAGFMFAILHANFKLRGAESDRDQAFVEALGKNYGVVVLCDELDAKDNADTHGLSIQESARELRYGWFKGFLIRHPDDLTRRFVLTAHHSDDNVETLLQHFFQGSGIAGLHGIPAIRDGIVRPLLFASRADLAAYAKEWGLEWVEDSSNKTVKYTRNVIRHELLPAIEKRFPQVRDNLADNLGRFREVEMLYRQGLARHLKRLLKKDDGGWRIPVEALRHTEPLRTVTWEIFSRFGFSTGQIDGILGLLNSETGRYLDSSTHRILHNRNWLLVTPWREQLSGILLIQKGQGSQAIPGGEIHISLEKKAGAEHVPQGPGIACLDAGQVKFPLLVRRWKQGDYYYPLGMRKKQKIARFLINAKVDRNTKDGVLVVESDKKIIWIVGHRIDDRFKLSHGSRERLTLAVIPS